MASERKIGGTVYRCEKLPAEEGLDMLMRVAKFFGAYPEAMGTIMTSSSHADAPGAFLPIALAGPDGAETKSLLIDLVQTCRHNGEQCIVGVHPPDVLGLLSVAWFAMEVNFKDFLSASVERAPSSPAQT